MGSEMCIRDSHKALHACAGSELQGDIVPIGASPQPYKRPSKMSQLDILQFPDTALRKVATPVLEVDGRIDTLVGDMLETMYEAPGIGLAATQIDVHERLVVIDVSEEGDSPLVLINPEILKLEGEQEMQEGCLSIPGIFENIKRAADIRVAAVDRQGEPFEMDADGLLAVCIQHEVDHLDGKLFVDYLSILKRNRIRKKMIKAQREENLD